jgi:hypothetical protein
MRGRSRVHKELLVDPHEPPPLLTPLVGGATFMGIDGLIAPCEFTPGFSCFLGVYWGSGSIEQEPNQLLGKWA